MHNYANVFFNLPKFFPYQVEPKMNQLAFDLPLANSEPSDEEENFPLEISYEHHFATLLTVQGYFNRIELDSIRLTENQVFVFQIDNSTYYSRVFSEQKPGETPKVQDIKDALELLWSAQIDNNNNFSEYQLTFKAETGSYLDESDTERPLHISEFKKLDKNSQPIRTVGVTVTDPKATTTKLLAEGLNIDVLWADVIRQSIWQLILTTAREKNQQYFAQPNFIAKNKIHSLIDEILKQRPNSKLTLAVDSKVIRIVSFPLLQPNHSFVPGMHVKTEHLSTGQIVELSDSVDETISNLHRTGVCFIPGAIGAGKSSLLWLTAQRTDKERCWFRVDSFSILDAVAIQRMIATYDYNYPIGFLFDDINLGNFRIFLKMVDWAKKNNNIWVLGTTRLMNNYLVCFHQSLSSVTLLDDEHYRKIVYKDLPYSLDDTSIEYLRSKWIEIVLEQNHSSTSKIEALLAEQMGSILGQRYDPVRRVADSTQRKSLPTKSIGFRTGKRTRKRKTNSKQTAAQLNQTQSSMTKIKEIASEEVVRERLDELNILKATSFILSLKGSVSIKSLVANQKFDLARVYSAIDRLQKNKFLDFDKESDKLLPAHPVINVIICKALEKQNLASWRELITASVLNSDSSFLEQVVANAIDSDYVNSFTLAHSMETRFNIRLKLLVNTTAPINRTNDTMGDTCFHESELEECIRITRGAIHGHLLKLAKEWELIYPIKKVPHKYAIPMIIEAITGERIDDKDDGFDLDQVKSQANSWYRKAKNLTLPQQITTKIIDIVENQFTSLDPHLIIEALKVLIGVRISSQMQIRIRDLGKKVASHLARMDIGHVMEIIEIVENIAKDGAKFWQEAHDQQEECSTLLSRIIVETPHACPLETEDDGLGPYIVAHFDQEIMSHKDLDVQDIVSRQNSALQLLLPRSLDIVCGVEDPEITNKFPFSLSFKHKMENSYSRRLYAHESAIPVSNFFNGNGWPSYLENGLKIIESIPSHCHNLLNSFCRGSGSEDYLYELTDIMDEAYHLRAPFNHAWLLDSCNEEFQQMQILLMRYDYNLFEYFEDLPEYNEEFYKYIQHMRVRCRRCCEEPWKLISDSVPIVFDEINSLLSDLQYVIVAAQNSDVHPAERWPVPEQHYGKPFQYIVSKSRTDLNGAQKKFLHEDDWSVPRPIFNPFEDLS